MTNHAMLEMINDQTACTEELFHLIEALIRRVHILERRLKKIEREEVKPLLLN